MNNNLLFTQKQDQESAIGRQIDLIATMRARRKLDEFGELRPDTPAIHREVEKLRAMRAQLESFVQACRLLP